MADFSRMDIIQDLNLLGMWNQRVRVGVPGMVLVTKQTVQKRLDEKLKKSYR